MSGERFPTPALAHPHLSIPVHQFIIIFAARLRQTPGTSCISSIWSAVTAQAQSSHIRSSTATRAWTQRQSACRTRPSTAPSLLVAPVVGEVAGDAPCCAGVQRARRGSTLARAALRPQTRAPAVEQLQRSRTEPRFAKSAETQCAGQERRGRVATSQNCSAAWSRSPQRFCQHRFKQQHPQQPRKDETTTNSTAVLLRKFEASLKSTRFDLRHDSGKECPRFRGSGC